MRPLLMSVAALALLAGGASAQDESRHIGKASVAPQVQDRYQAELRHDAPPQQAQAQPAQQAPQQGGGRSDRGGDRGNRGLSATNGAPPGATPQLTAPPQAAQQNRGDQNRGDRGNRDYGQDRRGQYNGGYNGNGYGYGRGDNRSDNRRDNNFDNRGGRTDNRSGNSGYASQRHDFTGFRDFHRSFNASRRYRAPYYQRPAGWYDHRWSFGEFLPSAFWGRDYWLRDFSDYDLAPPPYGAVWVRVGNDALLVDQDTGEVITVEYGVFY